MVPIAPFGIFWERVQCFAGKVRTEQDLVSQFVSPRSSIRRPDRSMWTDPNRVTRSHRMSVGASASVGERVLSRAGGRAAQLRG